MSNVAQTSTETWLAVARYDDGRKYQVSRRGNVRERIGGVQAYQDGTSGPRYIAVPVTDGEVLLTGQVRDERESVKDLVAAAFPMGQSDD